MIKIYLLNITYLTPPYFNIIAVFGNIKFYASSKGLLSYSDASVLFSSVGRVPIIGSTDPLLPAIYVSGSFPSHC